MKISTFFLIVILLSAFQACTTSESTTDRRVVETERQDSSTGNEQSSYLELADYLQRLSGVLVSGSGNNIQVKVRGSSSFVASTDPLYVVDGQVVGTTYSTVNNFVNVRDIDNVRVLKGSAASTYGVRGANGVILIETKK